MMRLHSDPNALVEFGKKFKALLDYHGVSQSELARQVDKLTRDIVNQMIVGNSQRLTPRNFLRCLQGLVILEKFTEEDAVKDWLEELYIARGIRYSDAKYRPLEEIPEGREILEFIQQGRERRRQKAHEKPKYTNIHGIPIIGRGQDIRKILSVLENKDTRLLVLVGLPGVGKTELARQVGIDAKTKEYFTRIRPLSLASETTSPGAVSKLLSGTLKDIPMRESTLIILHNCEQVNGLTQALHDFLDEYKHVTLLATSRRQMTQNDYLVHPLRVPKRINEPPDRLRRYDAVKLFLASANPSREKEDKDLTIREDNARTIAQLCIALDGIPLMLRLAASWVKQLQGVEGVYSWLKEGKLQGAEKNTIDDVKWHVSLNTVIERSYQLLEQEERALFRRLAVFAGKCQIESAIAVCNLEDDLPTEIPRFTTIVNVLSDHFLITFENEQIEIAHNTLRDYALRQLGIEEAEKVKKQFIDHYCRLAFDCLLSFSEQKYREFLHKERENIYATYVALGRKLRKRSALSMSQEEVSKELDRLQIEELSMFDYQGEGKPFFLIRSVNSEEYFEAITRDGTDYDQATMDEAQEKAIAAMVIGLVSELKYNNFTVVEVLGKLSTIHSEIVTYDSEKASIVIAELTEGLIELCRGDWWSNLPIFGQGITSFGRGSLARSLWGPAGVLWTKTEIRHIITEVGHKQLISHADEERLKRKYTAEDAPVAGGLTLVRHQFALLAFALSIISTEGKNN